MNKGSEAKVGIGLRHLPPEKSRDWFARAKRVLAGGISSSARSSTTGDWPYPLYMERGKGSRIWDVDGNQFIDYLLSYGSVVLGHGEVGMIEALKRQVDLGTMFGTCNTLEVEVAEQLCKMVPCAELVRFANSGSEAMIGAVRAARGYTGKNKILKFEGHYHGWVDVLAVSNRPGVEQAGPIQAPFSQPHSKGIPSGVVEDVVICPWNDPEVLHEILRRHPGQFAAIVAEPIVANNACIMPAEGYLETLREECTKHGIVLIFDEIVTAFRSAPGGAQEIFGVEPDIAVFSKALGGGLPISAFAGRRNIMEPIAANTVKHGGTYNGNPLCAAAALHTLKTLNDRTVTDRIRLHGEAIMDAIRHQAFDRRVACVVQGLGSMFQVVFNSDGQFPRQYRDLYKADSKRYDRFRQKLLELGIHMNSSGLACWFVSSAHGAEDLELTTRAIGEAMQACS